MIVRAAGTNCDVETQYAFELAGAHTERVYIDDVKQKNLLDYQIIALPGGFTYGDDIAAGKILANEIKYKMRGQFLQFIEEGNLIIGICNGFQVLLKSGVLLPDDERGPLATLAWNASGRFEDRWVQTKVNGEKCPFLHGIDSMFLPVAHAEGKFVCRDTAVLEGLERAGRLVLRYCDATGAAARGFPENPNGSVANVAGCCDETGRIFGLMPHPERFLDPTNHPTWTRMSELPSEGDGCAVFRNAVGYFA